MHKSLKNSLLVIAAIVTFGGNQVIADEQVATKLLNEFWNSSSRKAADQYFAGQEDRSARSVYAYALVKAHQHDVKMALRAVKFLHEKNPKTVAGLRLKIWLELRQNEVEAAMSSLIAYATNVNSKAKMGDYEKKEAVEFMGRIFGYLDGPVAHKVNEAERTTLLNRLMEMMSATEQAAFETGYQTVANTYAGFMSEKMKVDSDAAAQDAIVQDAKFHSLAAREKDLHEAEQRTAAERQQTRAQINKGLTDIARYDQAFAHQQAVYVGRPHRHLVVHSSGSTGHRKHHTHVVSVHRPVFRRHGFSDLHARRNILAGHYQQLRNVGAGQMNSLNKELKEITKAKNRTMAQKLRALRPSGKIVTKSLALKAKSRSIMTYEKFPLEMEKQLLLASK